MTEPIILAVDLGTSGMKVALITVSGKVLGWETEPIQLMHTPDAVSYTHLTLPTNREV